MALSNERVIACGVSPYDYEQAAIQFVREQLPNVDPYLMWYLVDLVDTGGRRYDIDLLVLGRHALYLVEIKHYEGQIKGDGNDWTLARGGHTVVRSNPARLTNHKAKVLGSLLREKLNDRAPWVQPLIFLSNERADIQQLSETGSLFVAKRAEIARALTVGEFRGASRQSTAQVIEKAGARAIKDALERIGVTPSKAARRVGGNVLSRLIEEGPGYQDFEAVHETMSERRCRVRSYLVPQATTRESREQLARAAHREARLLTALSDHRGILRLVDYHAETELGGPCIVFEHWPDAEPLGVFLRRNPALAFDQRIALLQQVGEALAYCHRKQIVHRGIHPGAVLVRKNPETQELEARLYNFQLAVHPDSSGGTAHLSALSEPNAEVYRAPELIEDPTLRSPESDIYSLGLLTYFVLTNRSPGNTLQERETLLRAGGGKLSLLAVRDDLSALRRGDADTAGTALASLLRGTRMDSLDDLLGYATDPSPIGRMPVNDWVQLLVDAATAPPPHPGSQIDPLEARGGQELDGGLHVVKALGTGSTARVLQVKRGESLFALKIALTAELHERLRAEAGVLRRLRSDRIVRLEGEYTLGPHRRLCLLLEDAGQTLADLLVQEGPPSLDYALRWGDDLLRALQHLEEDIGVQHRDIKPSNLGITEGKSKRARHLRLFDFSLSTIDATRVTAGTPAYRDPFLIERGSWDEGADRYAAAATLYELITGTRVRWGNGDLPATAAGVEANIEAERFDAAVRDRLLAFFRKAFARDIRARHPSTRSMLTEWTACFASVPHKGRSDGTATLPNPPAVVPSPTLDELEGITLDTPVAALPLSVRARNALDRSGVLNTRDLLELPRNHLSLIRGVGRNTVQEILKVVSEIEPRLTPTITPPVPLFRGPWRGQDVGVGHIKGLSSDAVSVLLRAGLTRLSQIAVAPKERIERMLAKEVKSPKAQLKLLVDALKAGASGKAVPSDQPQSIEAWLDALAPQPSPGKRQAYRQHVRHLIGLDPLKGQRHGDLNAVARALGISRQAVHISLQTAREHWRSHPGLTALVDVVRAALESLGGVAPLSRLGEHLRVYLPHERGADTDAEAPFRAQALLSLVGRLDDASQPPLFGRIHGTPWLSLDRERLELARGLGDCADRLAARDPLPSSDEVLERLRELLTGSSLLSLPADRLVTLAGDASQQAAPSARLELYPRGMATERALLLAAGALISLQLRPADINRIVGARYPLATPLPPRPALDKLVEKLQMQWDEAAQAYVRLAPTAGSSSYSHLASPLTTTHAPPRQSDDPRVQEARAFEEKLQQVRQRHLYRVLFAPLKWAEEAIPRLERSLAVTATSLDRELLKSIEDERTDKDLDRETLLETDREGPQGEHWADLRRFMRPCGERTLARLKRHKKPLLLVHPGLLARYQMDDFLAGLLTHSQRDDAPAVFLVIPTHETSGSPCIRATSDRVLPVPTSGGEPPLVIPESWVLNFHQGQASATHG